MTVSGESFKLFPIFNPFFYNRRGCPVGHDNGCCDVHVFFIPPWSKHQPHQPSLPQITFARTKQLSDTPDPKGSIIPYFTYLRTPKPLLACQTPNMNLFIGNNATGVRISPIKVIYLQITSAGSVSLRG